MLLIDFNQLAYATILEHLAYTKASVAQPDTARLLLLDTLRANIKKFRREYGPTVVIAMDDQEYWRREFFPFYKEHRKKIREKSQFDWGSIFQSLNTIREEFHHYLPYHVMCVEKAEADDIIAALVIRHAPHEKVLIVSSDKDFRQLHDLPNVEQYSPILKKYIHEDAPMMALKQQIIRGDSGDGIPNILSGDRVFVDGGRQKPILEKRLIQWMNQDPKEFCSTPEIYRNYTRNETLINLRHMPQNLMNEIHTAYERLSEPAPYQKFFDYVVANRLKPLLEVIDDFYITKETT